MRSGPDRRRSARALTARSLAAIAVGAVACASETGGEATPPETGWAAVRNPVLSFEDAAIKDAFVVRRGDSWHLGYSYIRDDPFRFRLGFSATRDFRSFGPLAVIDQPEVGGLASPDVVEAPGGGFVMTYNSHTRDVGDASNKLYFRTSSDLVVWSEPRRIHVEGADAPTDRLIDAALSFTDIGTFRRPRSREARPLPQPRPRLLGGRAGALNGRAPSHRLPSGESRVTSTLSAWATPRGAMRRAARARPQPRQVTSAPGSFR